MKKVNLKTITDTQSWYKIWVLNQWFLSYPCKTKSCQETERSLRRLSEPSDKPKVMFTDNSLDFGKGCLGIITVPTSHACAHANLFVRVALGLTRLKCLDCSIFSARHFQKNIQTARMHAMFRTLLDLLFTTPSQSTSTSSSLLSPSNWTPTAAPLCGRFAEQSPLTVTFVLWYVKGLSQLRKKQCSSLGKHTSNDVLHIYKTYFVQH